MAKFGRKKVWMHRRVASSFLAIWADFEAEGVLDDVLTINGFWSARMTRSGKSLSNHALGTAFDVNAAWNAYGKKPAAAGAKGSVHRLIPIIERHGWINGSTWTTPDGMHNECHLLGVE